MTSIRKHRRLMWRISGYGSICAKSVDRSKLEKKQPCSGSFRRRLTWSNHSVDSRERSGRMGWDEVGWSGVITLDRPKGF